MNKTQAYVLAAVAGSKETEGWVGKQVVLYAAAAPNGAQTIAISAPAARPPAIFPDGIFHYVFAEQAQPNEVFEAIAKGFGVDMEPNEREAARSALRGPKAFCAGECGTVSRCS